MRKIKLSDVARIAGVSSSTVDRVLHRRPGVKEGTLRRVEAAMRRLGYSPSSLGARLTEMRQNVTAILPRDGSAFLGQVRQQLLVESGRLGGGIDLTLAEAPATPEGLAAALAGIGEGVDAAVIVGLDRPEVTEAVNGLAARGVRVVTLVNDVPSSNREAYVGYDNFAAGRAAAGLMTLILPPEAPRVAVLIGDPALREHLDRRSGFEQVIASLRPGVEVVPAGACRNNPAEAQRLTARVLAEVPAVSGLYVIGEAHEGVLAALRAPGARRLAVIGHEVTPATRLALATGTYAAVIAHDTAELVRRALDSAVALDEGAPPTLPARLMIRETLPPA
jgi:LacI family transcriptional regulator